MKSISHILSVVTLLIALSACNMWADKSLEGLETISTEKLAQGISAGTLKVFDCNTPGLYRKSHIPSAVFMDYGDPDVSLLPQEKNAALVFYCKNTMCTASHKAARFALEQGFINVRVYSPGIDGWIEAGRPTESAN